MKKNTLFILIMAIAAAFVVCTSFSGCKLPLNDTTEKHHALSFHPKGQGYAQDMNTVFYDGEGNEIPVEAVNALVKQQFVITTIQEDSLVNKYFYIPQTQIDLPDEWQQISTDTIRPTQLTGYIQNGKLFIQFKNK